MSLALWSLVKASGSGSRAALSMCDEALLSLSSCREWEEERWGKCYRHLAVVVPHGHFSHTVWMCSVQRSGVMGEESAEKTAGGRKERWRKEGRWRRRAERIQPVQRRAMSALSNAVKFFYYQAGSWEPEPEPDWLTSALHQTGCHWILPCGPRSRFSPTGTASHPSPWYSHSPCPADTHFSLHPENVSETFALNMNRLHNKWTL